MCMRDISLHLLDLVQNSVTAHAKNVRITLSLFEETLTVVIEDDGKGMEAAFVENVLSPFTTSRTTRKVGLGIPLIVQNAQLTGGDVTIQSTPMVGTTLTATFITSSIDCLPLGDVGETLSSLILVNPITPEFYLTCTSENESLHFSTAEIRPVLEGVMLSEPEVIRFIKENINEITERIFGGKI